MKQKSKGPAFRPMPEPAPKCYFFTPDQNLNSFFALSQAVDLVNRNDNRTRLGLAFNNPALKLLAESVTWANLAPATVEELEDSSIPVVSLNPSPARVKSYQIADHEKDFELQTAKYPTVDPEQLKLPAFIYTRPMAIIRDAYDVFDIMPGGRPVCLYDEARKPRYLQSRQLMSAGTAHLRASGIKSGAFTLVESGYGGWDGDVSSAPADWGRVILLPPPEQLLSGSPEVLEEYIGLIFHPDCAALGIRSTDYILASVAAWHLNKHVVWDLRPKTGNASEDLAVRHQMGTHIPGGPVSISLISPMSDEPHAAIERDLVYAIGYYNQQHKSDISQNKQRRLPDRPVIPEDYTYPWQSAIDTI